MCSVAQTSSIENLQPETCSFEDYSFENLQIDIGFETLSFTATGFRLRLVLVKYCGAKDFNPQVCKTTSFLATC